MEINSFGLSFDEATHAYTIYGNPIPSVSDILQPLFPVDAASEVVRAAAERGTRVHEATELYDIGLIDEVDVDIAPYLTAYANWERDYQLETWDYIEHRMGSLDLGFAGTADRIGYIDGVPVIVDIKTCATCDMYRYALQLAAYQCLYQTESGIHCKLAVLQLKRDGSYMWRPIDTEDAATAWKIFKQQLNVRKDLETWKKRKSSR